MIDIYISEFIRLKLSEIEKLEQALEIVRKEFLEAFPIKDFSKINIEKYVIGGGTRDSFCYWLERRLEPLGMIRGATADKFGVYFGIREGDDERKYRAATVWGGDSNTGKAFLEVKREIEDLLVLAKDHDTTQRIDNNKITPMFKGKILSTYFPEIYFPIFSQEHVKFMLKNLGVASADGLQSEKNFIIDFKNSHPILMHWSNFVFMKFLYWAFGHSVKNNEGVNLAKQRDEEIEREQNSTVSKADDLQAFVEQADDYQDLPEPVPPQYELSPGLIEYVRSSEVKKIALAKAGFTCETDRSHKRFEKKSDGRQYTEAHHLIPMYLQSTYGVSLDVPANVVSLCSHCHNKLHYGKDIAKDLKKLLDERHDRLSDAGIKIDLNALMSYYN